MIRVSWFDAVVRTAGTLAVLLLLAQGAAGQNTAPPAGQPAIGAISIDGLRYTPPDVVTTLMGLEPKRRLTANTFLRALHRLEELPSSTMARIRYAAPVAGTSAMSVQVAERPRTPSGAIGWSTVGLHAAITRDIRVDFAGLASRGDLWQPSFRWPRERRRVGLQSALPFPGAPGIVRVEMYRERQTYARPSLDAGRPSELRRRIGVGYSDWIAGSVRIDLGVAADRVEQHSYVAFRGGVTVRWFADHLATHVRAERWRATDDGVPAVTWTDAVVDWRSTTNADAPQWLVRAGVASVSDHAPLALWPGAGSSLDRTALLRARQLVRRHILSGEVFGRRLGFASIERQHLLWSSEYGRLSFAGFMDVAKAWRKLDEAPDSRWHVDVGAGVRVGRPQEDTHLRLDLGVGLRDGRMRASAGYVTSWGRR